jgi:GDPmannose 4,6-dehydratase
MAEFILENTDFQVVAAVRRAGLANYNKNLKQCITNYGDRIKVVGLDITDKSAVNSLINNESPNYFINFAGNGSVEDSWVSPYSSIDANLNGVLHQLESLQLHPYCRYISMGSSEIFGKVHCDLQDESTPANPRNPYGVAKGAAQTLIRCYREKYELFASEAILYNAESPRRSTAFLSGKIASGVAEIKNAIDLKKKFRPIAVGNLESVRDWSHASDFADGIWKILNAPEPKSYILSSGKTHSVREFIEKSFRTAGIDCAWQRWFGEGSETLESLYGTLVTIDPLFFRGREEFSLCGNSSLARTELGWNPKYNFDLIIEELIDHAICQTKS